MIFRNSLVLAFITTLQCSSSVSASTTSSIKDKSNNDAIVVVDDVPTAEDATASSPYPARLLRGSKSSSSTQQEHHQHRELSSFNNSGSTYYVLNKYMKPSEYELVGMGDMDGDGDIDLIWKKKTGVDANSLSLWRMQKGDGSGTGTGSFIQEENVAIPNFSQYTKPGTTMTLVDTGDMNGDGIDDMLVKYTDTNNRERFAYILFNNSGRYYSIAHQVIQTSHSLGLGDVDGDGRAEAIFDYNNNLVAEQFQKSNSFGWEGMYSISDTIPDFANTWNFLGMANVRKTARNTDDLIFHNKQTNMVHTWSSYEGLFPHNPKTDIAGVHLGGWKFCGFGDFNGDGLDDMVFLNRDQGSPSLDELHFWIMDPAFDVFLGSHADGGIKERVSKRKMDPGLTCIGVGDITGTNKSGVLFRQENNDDGRLSFLAFQ